MKEDYLDKIMNMMAHHLMRRHVQDLLHLLGRHNLVGSSESRPYFSPNASSNLLLLLIPHPTLLLGRNDLLNRNSWGSSSTFFQSRGGGAFLGHLFLDDLHLPLTNAREGIIFLRLDSSVQLLVEFGCHLYTKKKKKKKKK